MKFKLLTYRVPIFLFLIKSCGKFLHYNFVAQLLHDLFGIDASKAKSCVSVFGYSLLGVKHELQLQLKEAAQTNPLFKVGYIRVNFTYFLDNGKKFKRVFLKFH
jgi:hypothetical protein